jgi:uncharacterized protein (TIRG00374 family)
MTLLSALMTFIVFSYLFTRITWGEVSRLIVSLDWTWVVLFVALSQSQHLVRTWRYRLLLRSAGQTIRFGQLFIVVLVRAFCVDLLPARSGELVYVYLLRTRLGIELGAAAASFGLSFLFDIMVLGPLIILATLSVAGASLPGYVLPLAGGILFLCAVVGVLMLPRCLRILFCIVPARFAALRRLVASLHRQVFRAHRAGVYAPVFCLSIFVRLFKYGSLYALLYALLKPEGFSLGELPFPTVFLGCCAAEMAASLPVSGIAGFGAYEGAWMLAFSLLGFSETLAGITAVSHHLLTQVYGYSLGLLALLALLIWKRRVI